MNNTTIYTVNTEDNAELSGEEVKSFETVSVRIAPLIFNETLKSTGFVSQILASLRQAKESLETTMIASIADTGDRMVNDPQTEARAEYSYALQSEIGELHETLKMFDLVGYVDQLKPYRLRLMQTQDGWANFPAFQQYATECRTGITEESEWIDRYEDFVQSHRDMQLPKGFLQALVKAGILTASVPAAEPIVFWIRMRPSPEEARKDIVALWYAEVSREKVAEYLESL